MDSEEHGNWVIDKENEGSPEHPIQMPYVNYGREAVAFEDAVYKFVDEHPEYDMKNYGEILEKAGINGTETKVDENGKRIMGYPNLYNLSA